MTLDKQKEAMDDAAGQILDGILADIIGAEAEEQARRQLLGRISFLLTGLKQIGFSAWLDTEPGGLIKITIDPNSWQPPIPGPDLDKSEGGA